MNTNPIIEAIKPMREAAMNAAEAAYMRTVEKVMTDLAAAGWDIGQHFAAVAPEGRFYSAPDAAYRSFVRSVVESDDEQRQQQGHRCKIVKRSEARIAHGVEMARDMAAGSFDAYAAKLIKKVGEVVAATAVPTDLLWEDSTLTVEKPDGSVEFWHTQRIINRSVLGKPYHQWPTRKVKR